MASCTAITAILMSVEVLSQYCPSEASADVKLPHICALHTKSEVIRDFMQGSERIGRSEVAGQALKEAQSINKSLSALGDVICALQACAKHIPFRNSKLTQVLHLQI
jgi:hypothetical protein